VSNDAARHQLADVLALAQEQMAGLAEVQRKRAALTGQATVADGTVQVTVNAQGVLVGTVIDEAYLDDYDFADLGDYVTEAARAAAQEVARRSAELLAPLTERRAKLPALSEIVPGAPDLRELFPNPGDAPDVASNRNEPDPQGDGWDDQSTFDPTVRS
jgi:DNA-binding protein YbaB